MRGKAPFASFLRIKGFFEVDEREKTCERERKQRQKPWARGYISREMAEARNARV
jgi:hypothetical protein